MASDPECFHQNIDKGLLEVGHNMADRFQPGSIISTYHLSAYRPTNWRIMMNRCGPCTKLDKAFTNEPNCEYHYMSFIWRSVLHIPHTNRTVIMAQKQTRGIETMKEHTVGTEIAREALSPLHKRKNPSCIQEPVRNIKWYVCSTYIANQNRPEMNRTKRIGSSLRDLIQVYYV